MLNPKFVSPFTKDIYAAICKEIERVENITNALTNQQRNRLELLYGWQTMLEQDDAVPAMDIKDERAPVWPIRL